jgi:hypothetical protein
VFIKTLLKSLWSITIMASLAEIRAKLAAADSKTQGNFQSDRSIYPHWNIQEGQTVGLRFLPDADPKNTYFWIERLLIKLPFNGVKGEANSKQVIVQVPCVEMWNETCPILTEVRTWFKDKSLEEMGRKYWKKKTYLYQGFVHNDPMGEEPTENPIRRFLVSPQVQNIVKSALMDPELEDLPTDYVNGLDFKVVKTSKGGYADYGTSTWSRKTTSLTEAEAAAIEKFGLYDLKTFLPKKPTDVELKVMKEMFEASVDGQPYDAERWGQYFRPNGAAAPGKAADAGADDFAPAPAKVATPATADVPFDIDEEDAPTPSAPVVTPAAGGSKAEDILALIRARQAK